MQHKYFHQIISTLQVTLDAHNCIEVLVMKGKKQEIKKSPIAARRKHVDFSQQNSSEPFKKSDMRRDFAMFNFIRGCIVCMLMLTPTAVWATHPFVIDDTATEGKGNFLFELTGVYAKDSSFKSTTETAF